MDLSVVVTTRNRIEDLIKCVESVRDSNLKNLQWEIVVVDDCSHDGTEKLNLHDLGLKTGRVIHNDFQQMMVRSRNIGVKETAGKYILFIDDDNVIDSEMIMNLSNFMNLNSDYGIIGPSMYFFDSKEKYLDYQKINLYTGHTCGFVSGLKKQVYDSDGVPNVFMVRREVFQKCGYFDEKLIQTFTEPDFARRVSKKGFKCGVLSKAITYHRVIREDSHKPRALGGKFSQKAYCLMRNRTVYISRYGNMINKIVYITLFSLFWPLVYSLFALLHQRQDLLKMYWTGFIDGIVYFFTGKVILSMQFETPISSVGGDR